MFQARRQEMKWNGFLLKNWTFRQRKVHYVQYQYYLFYSLLIGVRTHPTHPLPTGLGSRVSLYVVMLNRCGH